MGEYWKCEEDVEYDLFLISQFTDGQKFIPSRRKKLKEPSKEPPKETKQNEIIPNKSRNKSIYDFDDFSGLVTEEQRKIAQKELVSSLGRGYVMKKFQNVNKSDKVMPQTVLEQTERDIREVCPLGYSNEVIEAMYKDSEETEESGEVLNPKNEFKFSLKTNIKNGIVSKVLNTSECNELPLDFIEYNKPDFIFDNKEFPKL